MFVYSSSAFYPMPVVSATRHCLLDIVSTGQNTMEGIPRNRNLAFGGGILHFSDAGWISTGSWPLGAS